MITTMLLIFAAFGVLVLILIALLTHRVPRPINQQYFRDRWEALLSMVKSQEGMALAVINADKLLDQALKRRSYRGKTMGERLVSAQRTLSDNDAAWFAHKLRNRLVHDDHPRLSTKDAQKALAGFKQGLKDLGAL